MMSLEYVIPPPKVNSIPIAGDTRRFAVNRIFCVGRNYADHAREMGHDPDREPPFFFMKPATTIVPAVLESDVPLSTVRVEVPSVVVTVRPATVADEGATERTPRPNAATATSAMRLNVVFVDICFLSIVDLRNFRRSAWN
jgi:hypothetical protein